MKKRLFLVTCCVVALLNLSVVASAASTVASGNCGTNVTWELDSDGLLSISGSGNMRDYSVVSGQGAPWYKKASAIKEIVIFSGVTSIGDVAFANCINLTQISIPSSVTDIGDLSFQNCTSLPSVTIPSSVSTIGVAPFRGCTNLMEISVPTSNSYYTSYGGVLFDKNLTELIQFPAGRTGAYNIPYGVTEIKHSAISYCSLTSVSLPATVTAIEASAFYDSAALAQVTLSPQLQTLMDFAFYQCDLREIVLPASLQTVEDAAFEYNANLSNIALLNPSAGVNAYAFSDTASKNVTVHFAGTEAYYDELRTGSGLCWPSTYYNNKVLFLPATGTCGNDLTWYYFADGTLYLDGVGDMYDYTADTSPWCNVPVNKVFLPNGLTSIGAYAFAGQAFDTISLPSSIASIGKGAFEDCDSLNQIVFDGPKELWSTVPTHGAVSDSMVVCDCADGHTFSYGVCTQCGNHGGQCGGDLQWILVNNTLVISGSGAMDNYSNGSAPWSVLRHSITELALSEDITSIGTSAFWGLDAITEVTIPDSVITIGRLAFCKCTSLQEIYLPDGLKTIGSYAFFGCIWLKKLTLPDSVTTIDAYAFQECTRLTEISWSKNLTTIGDYAFKLCSSLTSITLPESVRTIGKAAFLSCENLTSISLPDQLSSLGDSAFVNCTRLTSITIPNGVTQLPKSLFQGCTNLTSVVFSDNVTSIGDNCFMDCSGLTSIPWPSALETLGNYSFDGCKKLTDVVIPDGVTVIPRGCFYDCTSMLEIVLPAGLTTIEDSAFYYSDTSNAAYMNYVFFQGTKEQWKAVSVGGYNYRLTVSSRMHYEASDHIEAVNPAVPPSCTTSGLTEGKHCPFCNWVFVAQTTVPATGHSTVTDPAVPATCTTSGLTEGTHCFVCNAVLTEQEITPVLGHSCNYHWVTDATKGNLLVEQCSRCDHTSTEALISCKYEAGILEVSSLLEGITGVIALYTTEDQMEKVIMISESKVYDVGIDAGVCKIFFVTQQFVPISDALRLKF